MLREIDFPLKICDWFLASFTCGVKLFETLFITQWPQQVFNNVIITTYNTRRIASYLMIGNAVGRQELWWIDGTVVNVLQHAAIRPLLVRWGTGELQLVIAVVLADSGCGVHRHGWVRHVHVPESAWRRARCASCIAGKCHIKHAQQAGNAA